MPRDVRSLQETRAAMCKHQVVLFLEYLRAMEGFLEAETQKRLQEREEIEAEIAIEKRNLETLGYKTVDVDFWDFFVSDIPSDLKFLYHRLRTIDELDLQLVGAFAGILRRTFFVSLYSFLDSQLTDECDIRKQARSDIHLSLNEISGRGIFRVKTYLVKVLEVRFSFDTPEWREIQGFNLLRNCIVHNEGRLEGFNREGKLREYIRRNEPMVSIELRGQERVVLSSEFCEKAARTVSKFLTGVIQTSEARAACC